MHVIMLQWDFIAHVTCSAIVSIGLVKQMRDQSPITSKVSF